MENVKVLALITLYLILLIIGFEYFIPNKLVTHTDYDVLTLLFFCILCYIPLLWLMGAKYRPSSLIIWVLYLVVVIPSIIVPYLSVDYDAFGFYIFSIFIVLGFFVASSFQRVRYFNISYLEISSKVFYLIFFGIYIYYTINVIRTFGFNLQLVSLRDVYDVRSEYKDQLSGSEMSGATIRWLLFIMNPFLIVQGFLDKKKLWMLIVGFCGELLIYSFSGLKSSLFIGFVLLALLYIIKYLVKDLSKISTIVLRSVVVLFLLVILIDLLFFSDSILYKDIASSLILRRNFIVPGHLSGHYYAFFDTYPKNYMANNSLFGILVNYQSSYNGASPPEVIGPYAFGSHVPHANASFIADGFAQYGYAGMIIASAILGICLHIYDSIVRNINKYIALIMLVPFAFTFSNSAIFTVLLGHGFGFCLLIMYLYACSQHHSKKFY